jgi:hypothetical protein
MSEKGRMKKTPKAIKVKDLPPKKDADAKVKGGSDLWVGSNRLGCGMNHNERLVVD